MRRKLLRKVLPKNDFGDRIYATCAFVIAHRYPNSRDDDPHPPLLAPMLSVAEKLAKPFRFIRVDFYLTDTVHVGELMFLPEAGSAPLKPMDAEYLLGAYFKDHG